MGKTIIKGDDDYNTLVRLIHRLNRERLKCFKELIQLRLDDHDPEEEIKAEELVIAQVNRDFGPDDDVTLFMEFEEGTNNDRG